MIKSLIAIVVGLFITTIYNNKDNLASGSSHSLFSLTSSVNHDLSLDSLGDAFSTIDWSNPIQIGSNSNSTIQNQPTLEIDDNDLIVFDAIDQIDEIKNNGDSDNLVEQQLEQIAQINEETEDNNQIEAINPQLPQLETDQQKQSLSVLAQPDYQENADNTDDSKQEVQIDYAALIDKTLTEQIQIFKQELEKRFLLINESQREINIRTSNFESSMSNLIENINQLKIKLKEIEDVQIEQNSRQNKLNLNQQSISLANQDQSDKQNNIQNQQPQNNSQSDTNTNEQIESIAQTIAATRKLLESLEINNDQILQQVNQSTTQNTIINQTSSKSDEMVNITQPDLTNTQVNEVENTNNKQNEQQMKTFAKGMLQYASNLIKNSQTEKAYEIMKQIEPVLSEDLDYLIKMAQLNKQMNKNDLAIAYYKKAAVLATLSGNYGAFQEVIGNVMAIDMLTAGDLINQYSSRFENSTNQSNQ